MNNQITPFNQNAPVKPTWVATAAGGKMNAKTMRRMSPNVISRERNTETVETARRGVSPVLVIPLAALIEGNLSLIHSPRRTRTASTPGFPTLVESDGQMVLLLLHRLQNRAMDGHLHGEQVNLLLIPNPLLSIEEQPKPQAVPGLIRWLASLEPPPGARFLNDVLHCLVDELLDEQTEMLRHQCDAVTATFMANTNNRMNFQTMPELV